MDPIRKQSRIAGLLYLLLVFAAPVRLVIVPGLLFVAGDAPATAARIAAHPGLFRLGMACDLACAVLLVFITLSLRRLFKDGDRHLAAQMVLLGGALPAAIYCFNLLNDAGALAFAQGLPFTAAFSPAQREGLVGLFLHLHHQTVVAAEAFWGLWLFPLAALVWRSRFLPRFLAVWLVLNGAGYLALCLAGLFSPAWEDRLSSLLFPALLGEIAFVLWLLVRGARPQEAAS